MTKRYPFKFLDAYNKADTDIFFGRDEEVEALYQMAFQSDILLVYGASGTGKTSLINCGLASRFQAHDWLALNIRRGSDINLSLQQKLDEATAGAKGADSDLDLSWLDEEEEATTGSPLSRQIQEKHGPALARTGVSGDVTLILGGQIVTYRFNELIVNADVDVAAKKGT